MVKSVVMCVEIQDHRGYNRTYEVCLATDIKSIEVLRGMYPNATTRSSKEWMDVSEESRDWDWSDHDSNISYWVEGSLRRWWEESEFCDGNIASQMKFLQERGISLSAAGY